MFRAIGILLLMLLLAVVGFFLWFGFSFAGQMLYAAMAAVLTLLFEVLLVLRLSAILRPKTGYIIAGALLGTAALVVAGNELRSHYIKSTPTVDEHELDLSVYTPFRPGSKTVRLKEPPSLRLKDSLPVMDGATALYPVYASFAAAVYPRKEYHTLKGEVRCTQTDGAFRDLIEGRADIIFTAAPSLQQADSARARSVEFQLTPIGREAFVFFVNKDNKVTGLSSEQLRQIYSGQIDNWRKVGGSWRSITAYQRPEGSGSQSTLLTFMDGQPLMKAPTDQVPEGMGGIIHQVATYRNFGGALGYSFRYYATEMVHNQQIKLLSIDGVYPDKENIRNNRYPLSYPFYAITTQHPTANTRKLLAWIRSKQGQQIIEAAGYTGP